MCDKLNNIKEYVKRLEELYQILETSNDITEDNPAFEMLCTFTENLCLCIEDLKAEISR